MPTYSVWLTQRTIYYFSLLLEEKLLGEINDIH